MLYENSLQHAHVWQPSQTTEKPFPDLEYCSYIQYHYCNSLPNNIGLTDILCLRDAAKLTTPLSTIRRVD